ncbi:MAG: hypothetical protein Q7P63_13510 [Verrucomicrobiota bacterium JB022]|nr:hypothetical protein [Verrucomicrobiota bacterium JB022]
MMQRPEVRRSVRTSQTLGWGYAALGALGVVGLLFDRSWLTWLGIVVPLIIGAGELVLSRRLQAAPGPGTARALCWHQLWILVLWALTSWALWALDFEALFAELPPLLQQGVEQAVAPMGWTGADYLRIVWHGTLVVMSGVLGGKLLIVAWVHHRAVRSFRLPPPRPASI